MPIVKTTVKYACSICKTEFDREADALGCEARGKEERVYSTDSKWTFRRSLQDGEPGYLYLMSAYHYREVVDHREFTPTYQHVLRYWTYTDQDDDGARWTTENIERFLKGMNDVVKIK